MKYGICRGMRPQLWFGEHVCHTGCDGPKGCLDARREGGKVERVSKARAICEACPVQAECLEYAIRNKEWHGIWGGLTERQRRDHKLVDATLARLRRSTKGRD